MGKTSIEYLFTEKADRMGTREWYKHILKNEATYATCEVVSLTRVKNLKSDWVHEYVQFIVEERNTKDRTRVYAERGNEIDLDWVTYGRNELGVSALKDLPLPLTSLTFGKRPTLIQLAEILSTVTNWGGAYELLGHSCFWFAYSTYEKAKRDFGGQEKNWQWVNLGGRGGGGLHDAWGFGVPYLFGFFWTSKAEKFSAEREQHMIWGANGLTLITPEEAVGQAVDDLLDEKTLKKYIKALELEDIEVSREMVEEAAADAKASVKEISEHEVSWNQDFYKEVENFCSKVLADPDVDINIAAYEASEKALGAAPEPIYSGPRTVEYHSLQRAMKAFVGRLLRDNDGTVSGS